MLCRIWWQARCVIFTYMSSLLDINAQIKICTLIARVMCFNKSCNYFVAAIYNGSAPVVHAPSIDIVTVIAWILSIYLLLDNGGEILTLNVSVPNHVITARTDINLYYRCNRQPPTSGNVVYVKQQFNIF